MRNDTWLILLVAIWPLTQQQPQLGTVRFETSCAAAVADDFNHAVALLHSFEYDEAREVFAEVSRHDPQCAMAKWGEAMTYFHGPWGEFNAQNGASAAAAAHQLANANARTTARERAYIDAISEVFSADAVKASRFAGNEPNAQGYSEPVRPPQVRYTERMGALHETYPEDDEAAIFYALALYNTALRRDATHADLHRCVSLLNPLFAKLPNHPGIAHYLIHCTDNPAMAREGLDAARKYAAIAPASAHAMHMPSHIFAQRGLWDEMIRSNRASLQAAQDDEHATVCQKADHMLHAMHYLAFALVQTGSLAEARDVMQRAARVPAAATCEADLAIILAGYVMETAEWTRGRDIATDAKSSAVVEGFLWEAIGTAAARARDLSRAKAAEEKLAALRDARAKLPGGTRANFMEVRRLTVTAWLAYQDGHAEAALTTLRDAADLEDTLGSANAAFKPVRELLADMLMLSGRHQEALTEYRAVLERLPNRFDALYGAGSAAFESGDRTLAVHYYADLLKIAHGDERPELAVARRRVSR